MDFNSKDWIERMNKAVGEQQIRDLINELPDERGTASTDKDGQESFTAEKNADTLTTKNADKF